MSGSCRQHRLPHACGRLPFCELGAAIVLRWTVLLVCEHQLHHPFVFTFHSAKRNAPSLVESLLHQMPLAHFRARPPGHIRTNPVTCLVLPQDANYFHYLSAPDRQVCPAPSEAPALWSMGEPPSPSRESARRQHW